MHEYVPALLLLALYNHQTQRTSIPIRTAEREARFICQLAQAMGQSAIKYTMKRINIYSNDVPVLYNRLSLEANQVHGIDH